MRKEVERIAGRRAGRSGHRVRRDRGPRRASGLCALYSRRIGGTARRSEPLRAAPPGLAAVGGRGSGSGSGSGRLYGYLAAASGTATAEAAEHRKPEVKKEEASKSKSGSTPAKSTKSVKATPPKQTKKPATQLTQQGAAKPRKA